MIMRPYRLASDEYLNVMPRYYSVKKQWDTYHGNFGNNNSSSIFSFQVKFYYREGREVADTFQNSTGAKF